jgi:GTP cyclohydrolase II
MADIVQDLKIWLAQLVTDAPHRKGELPEMEIDLVKRAINEIESLRSNARYAHPPK